MSRGRELMQLERAAFFSDAVFAIAITLLVIEIRLPEGGGPVLPRLLSIFPHYIGFVVSFLVIGRFWLGHHRLFGLLRAADDRLLYLNLLLLMCIAFMPFPTAVVSERPMDAGAVLFYAGWLAAAGLLNIVLIGYARRHAELHDPHAEPGFARLAVTRWLPMLIAATCAGGALAHPLAGLAMLTIAPLWVALFERLAVHRAARSAEHGAVAVQPEMVEAGGEPAHAVGDGRGHD